jgi:alpha-tubulin suppressor-like RCC1 family protein
MVTKEKIMLVSIFKISPSVAPERAVKSRWPKALAVFARVLLTACGGGGGSSAEDAAAPTTPTTPNPSGVVVTQVAAGGWHSAAVRSDGKLYA